MAGGDLSRVSVVHVRAVIIKFTLIFREMLGEEGGETAGEVR